MSHWLDALSALCRERLLDEKILIVPSLAIGHQIADRLAFSGTPWVNLRIETARKLAERIVGADLARENVKVLSRAQSLALIEEACEASLSSGSYFGPLLGQQGLYRAVRQTIEDLRHAGIKASSLPSPLLEDPRKAMELEQIASAYDEALRREFACDSTSVVVRAVEKLKAKGAAGGDVSGERRGEREASWIVIHGLDLSPAETELIELASAGKFRTIGEGKRHTFSDRDVAFVAAVGEENEVRSAFRKLLSGALPLDTAEFIYTERETYLPLLYELANEYGIDCTFAEGVAVSFTRPGQAVIGFLEWLGSGFDASILRRTLMSGAVELPGEGDGQLTPNAFARTLRDAAIGWGRDRYESQLERFIAAERGRGTNHSDEKPFYRAEDAERVLTVMRPLLASIPEPAGEVVSLRDLSRAASRFAALHSRIGSELDGMAKAAVCRLLNELAEVGSAEVSISAGAGRLIDAIRELHVAASNPRPGHLHVSSVVSGGYSGRKRTFIVGVDDARYPGHGTQDPILLDAEREAINRSVERKLSLSAERPRKKLDAFRQLLARLPGRDASLTVSYSSRNLLEEREQFPGPAMLELFRQVSGKRPEAGGGRRRESARMRRDPGAASQLSLFEHSPPGEISQDATPSQPDRSEGGYRELIAAANVRRSGFLPEEAPLSETEWWLSIAQAASERREIGGAVRQSFRWLAAGHEAEEARASDRFTVYDGMITPVPELLDPRRTGEVVSCSRIEEIAKCPYRYFLHRVLGLNPLEELTRDPLQWLEPRDFGSLFHEVAERFMTELAALGTRPFEEHRTLLLSIANDEAERKRKEIPPPNDAAYELRIRELHGACEFFLQNEIEHCATVTPRYFEAPFGFDEESVCAMASREPVELEAGEGRVLRVRGRIDRIDERSDGQLEVWDYKTGSAYSYQKEGFLHGGTMVQHAVYRRAVEILTQRNGDVRSVARSGYFFTSEKGEGERLTKSGDATELERLLTNLFDMVADGTFPHADRDACRFCDYKVLCNVNLAADRAERKLKDESNDTPGLAAWRTVREIV